MAFYSASKAKTSRKQIVADIQHVAENKKAESSCKRSNRTRHEEIRGMVGQGKGKEEKKRDGWARGGRAVCMYVGMYVGR